MGLSRDFPRRYNEETGRWEDVAYYDPVLGDWVEPEIDFMGPPAPEGYYDEDYVPKDTDVPLNDAIESWLRWLGRSYEYHTVAIARDALNRNLKTGKTLTPEEQQKAVNQLDPIASGLLLSIGSALLARGVVEEFSELDKGFNLPPGTYDALAKGQYTRLPSDYYTSPYDPETYKLQPVYDDNGELVQGVWSKAFDVNQDIGVNDISFAGGGFSAGGRSYDTGSAFKNALFYASMYGLKQFIFYGKSYQVDSSAVASYSGVGNVPIGGQPVGSYLPPWYYSKKMENAGRFGWMRSKFGDYLIKKRY